ncbi:MAG: hypothetical protein AB7G06_04240 [Bdellovibrionales bacterium]
MTRATQAAFAANATLIGDLWRVTDVSDLDPTWKQPAMNNRNRDGGKVSGVTFNGTHKDLYYKPIDCRVEAFLLTVCRLAEVPVQHMYLMVPNDKGEYHGLSELLPTQFREQDTWSPESQKSDHLKNVDPAKLAKVMAAILYLERIDAYGQNVMVRADRHPIPWWQDDDGNELPLGERCLRFTWSGNIRLIDLKQCQFGEDHLHPTVDAPNRIGSVFQIKDIIRDHRTTLQESNPDGLQAYDTAFKETWRQLQFMRGDVLTAIAEDMLPGTWQDYKPLREAITKLDARSVTPVDSLGIF